MVGRMGTTSTILCKVKVVEEIPNCFDFYIDGVQYKLFIQFGGWKNQRLPIRSSKEKILLKSFGMTYFMGSETWAQYKQLSSEERVAFHRMFRLIWGAYQIDYILGRNTLPWKIE